VARGIQTAGQFRGIDGLNGLEQFRRAGALVRLQVPDQVEAAACQISDYRCLAFELLDVVLAELPKS